MIISTVYATFLKDASVWDPQIHAGLLLFVSHFIFSIGNKTKLFCSFLVTAGSTKYTVDTTERLLTHSHLMHQMYYCNRKHF